MARRPALGRGLAALLGDGSEGEKVPMTDLPVEPTNYGSGTGVIEIPVDAIRRNPRQPRRAIEPEALEELARSIEAVGVVQPVIVRETDAGFELIAGERRWRAAQKAGFTVVPAIVRAASDVESLELALIENVVRQQLNPVDEAYALRVLMDDLGVTQENLAARVGKSRSAIANKIRLLDLPFGIQELLSSGALSEGHGRALLGLNERGRQLQLARRAAEKGLSVRQVEEEVRRVSVASVGGGANSAVTLRGLDTETLDEVRQAFFGSLGVVPRVKLRGVGGRVELPFKDRDELRRMLERLGT